MSIQNAESAHLQAVGNPAGRLSKFALLCSGTGLVLSLIRLSGIQLHVAGLQNANGALGPYAQLAFVLAFIALLMHALLRTKSGTLVVQIICVLILALCASTPAEMLIARLSVASIGVGIFLLTLPEQRFARVAQYFALAVSVVSTTVMLKYGYGLALIPAQFGVPSLYGAVQLNCCAIAMFFANVQIGPASVFAAEGMGGALARRVLLPVVILMPALGVLTGEGNNFETDLTVIALTANILLPLILYLLAAKITERDTALSNEQLQVARLLLSQERLERALQARSRFIANVSHELRTPLSTVIGATELTLLAPLSEEQRQLTAAAHDSAESLLRTVNDLLDISRLEVNHVQLHQSVVEVEEVIQAISESVQQKAQAKALQVVASIAESAPRAIITDRARLAQILLNLIDNAIKFSERGTITINVEADQAGALLEFSVADEGVGIEQNKLPLLFTPFAKVDDSLVREHGGIGLGLAISKGLVDLMGGDIGVESSGRGSRFWFKIPVRRTESSKVHENVQSESPYREPGDKILIVEDNATNAKILSLQLKRLGFQSDVVTNGEEAVQSVSERSYALILMDVQMPVMNGIEATKAIRKLESLFVRFTPIVAVTAHASPEDRLECLKNGMSDYISKPVSLATLQAVLERWLSWRLPPRNGSNIVSFDDRSSSGG